MVVIATGIAHGSVRMHDRDGGVAQDDSHTAPNKLTETWNFCLQCTYGHGQLRPVNTRYLLTSITWSFVRLNQRTNFSGIQMFFTAFVCVVWIIQTQSRRKTIYRKHQRIVKIKPKSKFSLIQYWSSRARPGAPLLALAKSMYYYK